MSVRTRYDDVNLRGGGFIYVSADSGPLAYSNEFLRHGAWHLGKGGLLFKVLVHELGHVFGLPHMNESIVMHERFPERVLSPLSSDLDLTWPTFEGVRLDGVVDERCFSNMSTQPFLDFFEIPHGFRHNFCYQLKLDLKSNTGAVFYGSRHSSMILGGTISDLSIHSRALGGVNIWLPPEQIVFPAFPA